MQPNFDVDIERMIKSRMQKYDGYEPSSEEIEAYHRAMDILSEASDRIGSFIDSLRGMYPDFDRLYNMLSSNYEATIIPSKLREMESYLENAKNAIEHLE